MRVASVEVPEVVQVAIRENDEAAVEGAGVLAGLLLADERLLVGRFGLEDDERKASGVEQKEVDEAFAGLLEIFAEVVRDLTGRVSRPAPAGHWRVCPHPGRSASRRS